MNMLPEVRTEGDIGEKFLSRGAGDDLAARVNRNVDVVIE